jgi:hypothetical protein
METNKIKGNLWQIEEFEYSNITPEQLNEIIEVSRLKSNKRKFYLVYNNEEDSISLIFVRDGEQIGIMTDLPTENNGELTPYYFAVGYDNLDCIYNFGERDAIESYEECYDSFEFRQLNR